METALPCAARAGGVGRTLLESLPPNVLCSGDTNVNVEEATADAPLAVGLMTSPAPAAIFPPSTVFSFCL